MAREGPFTIRRGEWEGLALLTYIPQRRGARHYADAPSVALGLAKLLPTHGREWAATMAGLLADLVPEGLDCVTCPPASRRRSQRGWYFARCLAEQVAAQVGLPFLDCLRWIDEGTEAAKGVKHQAGQGRKLGREVACEEDLSGQRVLLIDDGWTTGITAALCREALLQAGAAEVHLRTLFCTERTAHRPAQERARIKRRAELRKTRCRG